jgi:hypothetical protein
MSKDEFKACPACPPQVQMRNAVLPVKCMLETDLLKGLPKSAESA